MEPKKLGNHVTFWLKWVFFFNLLSHRQLLLTVWLTLDKLFFGGAVAPYFQPNVAWMCKSFSSITSQLLGVVVSGAITPLKKKMPGCAAETLWKEQDPEADAAGRAASVQWFINHNENKQVVRQARVKTRTRSNKENKSERVEEPIQSAKQKHKKGKVNKTQVQLISVRQTISAEAKEQRLEVRRGKMQFGAQVPVFWFA